MSKSGSSAIQKLLSDNQQTLQNHNLIYPGNGRRNGNHFPIHRQIQLNEDLTLLREALVESSGFQMTILSCEGFWLLDEDGLDRMARALSGHDVTALLYLRSPRRYLPSSYRQGIKRKGIGSSVDDYATRVARRLDYPALLKMWSNRFRLCVRVYDDIETGIESDFLSAIGHDSIDLVRPVERVNATPNDGALNAVRAANRFLPLRINKHIRAHVISHAQKYRFFGSIDDRPFHTAAAEAVRKWDQEYMLKFVSQSGLDSLTSAQSGESRL
jgi:hypothetical protein